MMKLLISAGFFLFALTRSANAQFAVDPFPSPWVGCYELRVTAGDVPKQIYGKLPRRFQLLPTSYAGMFAVKTWHNEKEHPWPFSGWKSSGNDAFTVDWGTGFVGYTVTVGRSSGRLLGTAQPWSDDRPDGWAPKLTVEIWPIGCRLPIRLSVKLG
jgi:hypothetical protein